jgi:hypothetical protein
MTRDTASRPLPMPQWKVPLQMSAAAGMTIASHQQLNCLFLLPLHRDLCMVLACADLEAIVTAVQRLR